MTPLAVTLGCWVAGVDPPAAVRASTRARVLDIVGLSLAALPLDTSRAVVRMTTANGGARQARAIGVPTLVPAAQAAFVNGVLAHSLDYDDTHLPSVLHPSASVVPAVLAAGEAAHASGRAVVDAAAAGIELCVRLGMAGYDPASRQSVFFEHGQHATSICGAIAGAAAAAKVAGGDAAVITHAMSIAVSMASGVIEANRTGGTVKRLHCGWAAHAAVTAAELARHGITGAPSAIEGRFGFAQAFLRGEFRPDAITDGLDDPQGWELPGIFFKPYPANHFTHAGIDAAIALRRRGVRPDDVVRLVLGVATPTVRTIGEPIELKRAPATGYQAQFSGPYAVAAGLLGGGGLGVGLDDFTDELATDPGRRSLMAKVSVVGDPRCDVLYPHHLPAVLTAHLRDGTVVEEQVLRNLGGPDRPLTEEQLRQKLRDNAGRVLAAEHVTAIEDAVHAIDRGFDAASVLAPTAHTKEQ